MCHLIWQIECKSWRHPKGGKFCVTLLVIVSPDGARHSGLL
jgi:hypothetical protein